MMFADTIRVAIAIEPSSNSTEYIFYSCVVAMFFIAIHFWYDRIHKWIYKTERMAGSFSGGMAIAYVFIHLLSELEKSDRFLAIPIHFLSLMGFLVFYGMQRLTWKYSSGQQENWIFYIQLFFASLYNFLLIYAMPSQFKESLPFTVLYVVAMGLHILSSDNSLGEKSSKLKFKSWGRYVLIAVVVAAAIIDIGMGTPNELLSDIMLAILAGMLLFNIFTEELPSPENTSFRWFVAGVIVYVLLLAGSWVVESQL